MRCWITQIVFDTSRQTLVNFKTTQQKHLFSFRTTIRFDEHSFDHQRTSAHASSSSVDHTCELFIHIRASSYTGTHARQFSIRCPQDLFDQAQDASRLTPAELSHLVYSGINGFASKNEEDAEMSSLSFGASSPLSPSPSPMRVDGDSHSQRVAAGLRSVPHTQFRNHLVSQNLRRFAQRHDIPMEVSGGLLELRKLEQRCLDDLQHDGTRREALTGSLILAHSFESRHYFSHLRLISNTVRLTPCHLHHFNRHCCLHLAKRRCRQHGDL